MFYNRHKHHHTLDIWPGFVDAMATVLMVIIFVLMTFIIAQLFLTEALNNRDNELSSMNKIINKLQNNLLLEERLKEEANKKTGDLQALLNDLKQQLSVFKQDLVKEIDAKFEAEKKVTSLSAQINELNQELARLTQALNVSENQTKEKDKLINNLKEDLNKALLEKIEELNLLKAANSDLKIEQSKQQKASEITQYRSEFFSQLQQVLGKRKDIRVVGDRFVFQSEVLFEVASAELGTDGENQLQELAKALKEISSKIPKNVNWILRVDGHTDQRPIKNSKFPSNWELSAARAIAVVRYLISQGIEQQHLVAAGFGEYQPLSDKEKEEDMAKNRRIEFKLDQR